MTPRMKVDTVDYTLSHWLTYFKLYTVELKFSYWIILHIHRMSF